MRMRMIGDVRESAPKMGKGVRKIVGRPLKVVKVVDNDGDIRRRLIEQGLIIPVGDFRKTA